MASRGRPRAARAGGWGGKRNKKGRRGDHATQRVRDRESRIGGGSGTTQTEGASRASDWEGR